MHAPRTEPSKIDAASEILKSGCSERALSLHRLSEGARRHADITEISGQIRRRSQRGSAGGRERPQFGTVARRPGAAAVEDSVRAVLCGPEQRRMLRSPRTPCTPEVVPEDRPTATHP